MFDAVDSVFAGRAYAAYVGIYTAASLVWLWAAEGQLLLLDSLQAGARVDLGVRPGGSDD